MRWDVADITEERNLAEAPELLDPGPAALPRAPLGRPRRWQNLAAPLQVATDALLIVLAFALAYWVRYQLRWPAPFNQIVQEVLTVNYVPLASFLPYTTLLVAVLVALFAMKGVYRMPRNTSVLDRMGPIISGTTTGIALVVLLTIIQRPLYSRLLFAFAWATTIILLGASRMLVMNVRRWRWARGIGRERVLVVGGSLGARALNEAVPQALALIDIGARPQVTHQTGSANLDAVRAGYERAGVEAELLPFIDDMAQRLADCDVIVCRAGAVTVSELCAAGVAAVLVPLVVSTTSHQRDNAQWLAGQGAGLHLPQSELSPKRLAELLSGLTREALLAMAGKARALARPQAAARVADQIEGLVAA